MQVPLGTPVLRQLTPFHGFEPSHQRYVPLSRFHGSQRLNLMRPTRMPASSRRYNHGDPVNLIDWRAYARNEQLVVREQNDEASCRLMLLIDEQPTLDWPDAVIEQRFGHSLCTKRELTWRLALHLSYQSLKWGDAVRLYCLRDGQALSLTLRSQVDAAIFFEKMLAQKFIAPLDLFNERKTLDVVRAERCDLLFWFSDGFAGLPDWLLQKKGALGCWVQVLSTLEVDPSWLKGDDSYFDESQAVREYMGAALLQENYLQKAIGRWQEEMSGQWLKHHRNHILVTDDTPIQSYLMSLEKPGGLSGRGRGPS